MTFHFVTFRTEGPPNDKGFDLLHCEEEMKKNSNEFQTFEIYTPKRLRDAGFEQYVKEYPSCGVARSNPHCQNIGFFAWKPKIILEELLKVNDGDIVVYRDCNCKKYPSLNDFSNIQQHSLNLLNIASFDFVIPREDSSNFLTLGKFCKTNVIKSLAKDVNFTRRFPLLIANHIIVRKSSVTVALVEEWLKHCENEEFIDGNVYGEMFPEFMWFTPEQGILGVIISNWIIDKKIPASYPGIVFNNRNLSQYLKLF
jgi:hypothetical protein